jgi:hypothetical protein
MQCAVLEDGKESFASGQAVRLRGRLASKRETRPGRTTTVASQLSDIIVSKSAPTMM